MKFYTCEICNLNVATQRHHKFSQTKLNKKLYPEFIDDPRNLQYLCADCHISQKKGLINWGELKFCDEMGIIPRSKECKLIYNRIIGNSK